MRRSFVCMVGAALLLSACGTSADSASFELTEFSVTGPNHLRAGSQKIEIANSGSFPHTLIVTDSNGIVEAATSLIPPGETTTADIDLSSGEYLFTCRIVVEAEAGRLVDHFEEGMSLMVEVRD